MQMSPGKMEQSQSLISAQVQFMEDRLALVHIPRDLYPYFQNPILQVLFHEVEPIAATEHESHGCDNPVGTSSKIQPAFLNLSITPVECSVMCPRQFADEYFAPLVERFFQVSSATQSLPSISKDDFIAMQVYGEGLEAGQRVLELTTPLSMAGISIFFISTYFADYIVVPLRSKAQVIEVLENRGFTFELSTEAFHKPSFNNSFSPASSRSANSQSSPPSTPRPSSLNELQSRTFSSLRRNNVVPSVDTSLRLVQCAAHHPYSSNVSSTAILRDALTTTLIVDNPRFLSLTLTAADPAASLLLEQRLLPRFSSDSSSSAESDDDSNLLLGSKKDILIPIMLDLRNLPLEATGIVCGVASRLADATRVRADESTLSHLPPSPSQYPVTHDIFHPEAPNKRARETQTPPRSPVYSLAGFDNTITDQPTHDLQPDLDTPANAVEISFLSTARAGTIIVDEHDLHRAMRALEAESHDPEKAIEDLEI